MPLRADVRLPLTESVLTAAFAINIIKTLGGVSAFELIYRLTLYCCSFLLHKCSHGVLFLLRGGSAPPPEAAGVLPRGETRRRGNHQRRTRRGGSRRSLRQLLRLLMCWAGSFQRTPRLSAA